MRSSERSESTSKRSDGRQHRADGGSEIGAILLAAGESTRFGDRNKLLARVGGTPIVRHATETLCAGIDGGVTVITGYEANAVQDCLADLPVTFRTNPAYADGQSSSVREGVLEARKQGWEGTVFALGDMPCITPESIKKMIATYEDGAGSIVAAAYDGTRGNPVLFSRQHYSTLATVTGDVGGREFVETHPESVLVETGDPGVLRDINREDDLPSEHPNST